MSTWHLQYCVRTGSLTHNDHVQFLRLNPETYSVRLPFTPSTQNSNFELKDKCPHSHPSLQQVWQLDYCPRSEHKHMQALLY